jgi:hypothetical protein
MNDTTTPAPTSLAAAHCSADEQGSEELAEIMVRVLRDQ